MSPSVVRTIAVVGALALASVTVAGPRLVAQQPPTLQGAITDLTGRAGDVSGAEDAARELADEHGIELYSLYVNSTDGVAMDEYVERVRVANNLGGSDGLLVVALNDRTYELWLGDNVAEEVSQEEQDNILADAIEPNLVDGDLAGASEATANELGDAVGGGGGGFSWASLLVPLAILAGLAALAWWAIRRFMGRKEPRPGAPPATEVQARIQKMSTRELKAEASTTLLRADEVVREARQELAFAEAEYTDEEIAAFHTGLQQADERLKSAFLAQSKVDDSQPESEAEQCGLLEAIYTDASAAIQTAEA
ncbi:MAG: TPM domain-containing protein, partial [Anaerolineales bacterium]